MKRAAIFIGVDKAGDLPELNDAAEGARSMEQWAIKQGIEDVFTFTDHEPKKKVDVQGICDAIDTLLIRRNVEQLIIYFAGHGINRDYNEYWLLSDAPRWGHAAINVAGSI